MKKIVLIISLFICPQAFSSDYLKVLYVADQYHTIGTNKYLMTRETPTDTFSIFYENVSHLNCIMLVNKCIVPETKLSKCAEKKSLLDEILNI